MMFSVSDLLGVNPFTARILANAAGAAYGMSLTAGAADSLQGDRPLVAEAFAAAGWATVAVVSNAVINAASGLDRGFATFDDSAVRYGGLLAVFRRHAGSTWAGWVVPRRRLDSFLTVQLLGGIQYA